MNDADTVVYEVRAFWEDAAVDHGTTTEGSLRYRASRALESWALAQADQLVGTVAEHQRGRHGGAVAQAAGRRERDVPLELHDAGAVGHGGRADPGARANYLQALAWAELANARRANDDMAEAETAMMRALDLQGQGTGSELLLARLADLSASLFCDQRRFDEAFQMLDTAYGLYERLGSAHDAGRVLVMKGLYTGYTGNAELGLQILSQGLASIDRDRDPRLTFRTLHNILLFRVELGDLAEARRQLDRMAHLYDRYAGPHERVKLRSIEGKIAAALGDLLRAEELLRGVRAELDADGLGYQAAIITLDLASVCLQLGKTGEVRRLVQEMVESFRSLRVEREAMAALSLLSEAVEQEVTTVGLIARVASVLHRLERSPGLLVRTDQV